MRAIGKAMQSDNSLTDVRCKRCKVLLYRGRLDGEIKCRSCGLLQTCQDFEYNYEVGSSTGMDNGSNT